MGWWTTLSDAHVKFATIFKRIDDLGGSHAELVEQVVSSRERIARLEGASSQAMAPEVYRQVLELQNRVAKLEMFIRMSASSPAGPALLLENPSGPENGGE